MSDVDACIFVYDVGNKASFEDVKSHHEHHLPHPHLDKVLGFVIANKIDLNQDEWEVTKQEGETFCQSIGAIYIQMSAKTGEGGGTSVAKAITSRIILERIYHLSASQSKS
jgi:GTPase SAR1 family protein